MDCIIGGSKTVGAMDYRQKDGKIVAMWPCMMTGTGSMGCRSSRPSWSLAVRCAGARWGRCPIHYGIDRSDVNSGALI